eukprot:12550133-Alexandrium_andersonii.AAC.1
MLHAHVANRREPQRLLHGNDVHGFPAEREGLLEVRLVLGGVAAGAGVLLAWLAARLTSLVGGVGVCPPGVARKGEVLRVLVVRFASGGVGQNGVDVVDPLHRVGVLGARLVRVVQGAEPSIGGLYGGGLGVARDPKDLVPGARPIDGLRPRC